MSRRLLKFPLHPNITGVRTADAPTFRAVGWQDNQLVVWVEAEPISNADSIGVTTSVLALMTGQDAPVSGWDYVGTASHGNPDGIVAHVYAERPNPEPVA